MEDLFRCLTAKKINVILLIKNIFLLFFFLLIVHKSFAQKDCSVLLKDAEKLYIEGAIDSIPKLIDSCFRNGFTRKEKIQAIRLYALINLYNDRNMEAENYMLNILKLDPEYEVNKSIEEPEFVLLYNDFVTYPVWAYGFYGGLNFSDIRIIEKYGVENINTSSIENFMDYGFQFGLKYNRNIVKGMELNLDLQFAQNKYTIERSSLDFSLTSFSESQLRLSVPVSITYEIGAKKLKPFIRLGSSVGYLLSSKATVVRSYSDNSHAEVKGSDVDLTKFRNGINAWLICGAGIKYKVPRGNIFLDLRYNYGLLSQTRTETRYENSELIYKYYYIDNDFTISNISLSLGYVYLFYKPKKR